MSVFSSPGSVVRFSASNPCAETGVMAVVPVDACAPVLVEFRAGGAADGDLCSRCKAAALAPPIATRTSKLTIATRPPRAPGLLAAAVTDATGGHGAEGYRHAGRDGSGKSRSELGRGRKVCLLVLAGQRECTGRHVIENRGDAGADLPWPPGVPVRPRCGRQAGIVLPGPQTSERGVEQLT